MTNWETILETDNFIVDYDKSQAKYRVTYFEDNHFVDDVVFESITRGEWIETGYESLFTKEVECSNCGKTQLGTTKHCPNCGARMEYSGKIKTGFYIEPKNYHISQRLADGGK